MTTINFRFKFIIGEKGGLHLGGCRAIASSSALRLTPVKAAVIEPR